MDNLGSMKLANFTPYAKSRLLCQRKVEMSPFCPKYKCPLGHGAGSRADEVWRSEPLTLRRGPYAETWLEVRHGRASNHVCKALWSGHLFPQKGTFLLWAHKKPPLARRLRISSARAPMCVGAGTLGYRRHGINGTALPRSNRSAPSRWKNRPGLRWSRRRSSPRPLPAGATRRCSPNRAP